MRRLITDTTASETIMPNENEEEAKAYEERIKAIKKRMELEKEKEAENELTLQAELGQVMDNAEQAEEYGGKYGGIFKGVSANPLKPALYPIQKKLRKAIYALRIARSVVLWNEIYYTFWLVTACFATSVVFLFIPFGFILRWVLRIVAWVGLGPWNAIIDKVYFSENPDMTDAERDEALRLRMKARYHEVLESATNYFVRRESATKMKDMKKFMFGEFLLRVPRFCEDLFEDYPLPASYCSPIDPKKMAVTPKERKYGQLLKGDMIPMREIQSVHAPDVKGSKKKKAFWKKKQKPEKPAETTPLLESDHDEKKYS